MERKLFFLLSPNRATPGERWDSDIKGTFFFPPSFFPLWLFRFFLRRSAKTGEGSFRLLPLHAGAVARSSERMEAGVSKG